MSKTMLDPEGRQYHLKLKAGDVGRYVFLPGDPGRVPKIAAYLDGAEHVATHREYTTYTGTINGEKVSVTSTGIGGPSAAIAIEELAAVGADTFIRVGTSGPIQEVTKTGDLCITLGAVRDEGTSLHYMPIEFPAVADLDVTLALRDAAARLGKRHHVGISHSKDSFYGEISPERMPVAPRLKERWQAWVGGGLLCSEMEAAALFVAARVLKVRAGGIMVIIENKSLLEDLLPVAVEAVKILIERDKG